MLYSETVTRLLNHSEIILPWLKGAMSLKGTQFTINKHDDLAKEDNIRSFNMNIEKLIVV